MSNVQTKMFEEQRVVRRAGPDAPWTTVAQSAPVDAALNGWLRDTGHRLLTVSPPGLHSYWLDAAMTTRAVVVAVVVVYQENQRVDADRLADPVPGRPGEAAEAPPAAPPADHPGDL